MDLATGHVAALAKLEKQHLKIKVTMSNQWVIGSKKHWVNLFQMYNLGTGKGVSVMELIKTFEQINNVKIPYQVEPRRPGDISEMYADPWVIKFDKIDFFNNRCNVCSSLAEKELNWKASKSIQAMCKINNLFRNIIIFI